MILSFTWSSSFSQVVRGQPARLRIMVDRALQQVDAALQGAQNASGGTAAAAPRSQSDADAAMQALLVCGSLVVSHACFSDVRSSCAGHHISAGTPGYWLSESCCAGMNNHILSMLHAWYSGMQEEEGHATQGAQQPSKAALKRARKKAAQKAAASSPAEPAADVVSACATASQPGERLPCSGGRGGTGGGGNARPGAAAGSAAGSGGAPDAAAAGHGGVRPTSLTEHDPSAGAAPQGGLAQRPGGRTSAAAMPDAHNLAAGIGGVRLGPAAGTPAAALASPPAAGGPKPAQWMLCPISKVSA